MKSLLFLLCLTLTHTALPADPHWDLIGECGGEVQNSSLIPAKENKARAKKALVAIERNFQNEVNSLIWEEARKGEFSLFQTFKGHDVAMFKKMTKKLKRAGYVVEYGDGLYQDSLWVRIYWK